VGNYARFHQNRLNLAIHTVAVPLVVAGVLGVFWSLAAGPRLWSPVISVGLLISLALQRAGHKREGNPPLRFRGPGDFVRRILVEQFYTFPAFVMSGGWQRAWLGTRDGVSAAPSRAADS
jgi:hypothetical protein